MHCCTPAKALRESFATGVGGWCGVSGLIRKEAQAPMTKESGREHEDATGGWSTYATNWGRDVSDDETVIEHQFGRSHDPEPTVAPPSRPLHPPSSSSPPQHQHQQRPPRQRRIDPRKTPLLALLRLDRGGIHDASKARIIQGQHISIEQPFLQATVCQAPGCSLIHRGQGQHVSVRADMHVVTLCLRWCATQEIVHGSSKVMHTCSPACANDIRDRFKRQFNRQVVGGLAVMPDVTITSPDFTPARCQSSQCADVNGGRPVELPTAHMFKVWRKLVTASDSVPQPQWRLACSWTCADDIEDAWIRGEMA
jgi:hypothetical protein